MGDADADMRIDLAQRERLSAISQHLVTAITGLNDMFAVHADLEATRTVWQWVAHAPASTTAGANLQLLRELRQAQLSRALCDEGEVSHSDLHCNSDDEGGFAAGIEGGTGVNALSGLKTRLRVVSAFQSRTPFGASKYSAEGGSAKIAGGGAAQGPQSAAARLQLAASRAGTVVAQRRGGGGDDTPFPPTGVAAAATPLVTINESVGSDGALTASKSNGRAAEEGGGRGGSEPPFERSALGEGGAAFDMDVARAAVRSLIKPVWFSALYASGRRRSTLGRAAGGVRSISRILTGSTLSGLLSGRSSDAGSETHTSAGTGVSNSKFSYVSGDSTTADGLDSSGNGRWGVPSPEAPPFAGPKPAASRRASAPPMRVEVESEQGTQSSPGDSKLLPQDKDRPAPPPRPTPPPLSAKWGGVKKVAGTAAVTSPILDDVPLSAVSPTGGAMNPLASSGATLGEPSSRERSVAAARRFSSLVTAMSGVRQLQRSFRERHAEAVGGVRLSTSPPRSVSMAQIGGGAEKPPLGGTPPSPATGGSPGSSPGAATLSPFGESPLAHGPTAVPRELSPGSDGGGSSHGDSKTSALNRLKLASTKMFGGGGAASHAPPTRPSPGAGRAYVLQSDRAEVVAARAAVAAAIDSMSPAFQQLGAGLDSVARLLLKHQAQGGKGGSGRSKLARARTKLGIIANMHSSRGGLTAERGDSTLSGDSENSSSTPRHRGGTGGVSSPGSGMHGGHGTLSLGGTSSDRETSNKGGSAMYEPPGQARAMTSPSPEMDSKGGCVAGGIGFNRGLPTVRSAATIGVSKYVEGGEGGVAGRPPLRNAPDGAASGPAGVRYKRLSQSMATAGARSRLLASAGGTSPGEGGLSPDRMGGGESALPPPGHFFPVRHASDSTGNMSYEHASADGSWGGHPAPGAGDMESGRNSADGNNSIGSHSERARPAMQLAAPGGAVFGGSVRGGARLGASPPGAHMGPLSPTTMNAARMATLMGALDKLDASAAALADNEEV